MIQSYQELNVWKRSVALATELYRITGRFPDTERYGLSSQIRRAAVSIAANIAEGWGRGSTREYVQFLTIARGSLLELETHFIIARNLEFLKSEDFGMASSELKELGKMLNGLIRSLRSRDRRAA